VTLTTEVGEVLEKKSIGWTFSGWVYYTDDDISFFFNARTVAGTDEIRSSIASSTITCTYDDDTFGDINSVATVNTLNKWHHVGWVVNSSLSELYINGVLEDSDDLSGVADLSDIGLPSLGERWLTGAHRAGGDANYFNGSIDEVRIYSSALTSNQVFNLYNGTDPTNALAAKYDFTPSPTNYLTAAWRGDRTGKGNGYAFTNIVDCTGNVNDGTAYNSPTIEAAR